MLDPQWAEILGTPIGQLALAYLKKVFWCEDIMYQPGMPSKELAFREGQRSVVLMLERVTLESMLKPEEVPGTYAPEQLPKEDENA